MGNACWRKHEKAVADFFGVPPGKSGQPVHVPVVDWLTKANQPSADEPWTEMVVACVHRGSEVWESYWLKAFWERSDALPAGVTRVPVMLFPNSWGLCKLGDFHKVYRALLASRAPGWQAWLRQVLTYFHVFNAHDNAPSYMKSWVDLSSPQPQQLPLVCLGSELARGGPGGGKVVIFELR